MSQQRMIRLGIGALLALSLIGFDTALHTGHLRRRKDRQPSTAPR